MTTFPYPALELTSGTMVEVVGYEGFCARLSDGGLAWIKDLIHLTTDTPEWVFGARRDTIRDFMAWKSAQIDQDERDTQQDVIYGGCQ